MIEKKKHLKRLKYSPKSLTKAFGYALVTLYAAAVVSTASTGKTYCNTPKCQTSSLVFSFCRSDSTLNPLLDALDKTTFCYALKKDSSETKKWSNMPRIIPDSMLSIGDKDNFIKAINEGRAFDFSSFLDIYGNHFAYDTISINKSNVKSRMCLGRYIPYKKIVEIKKFVADTLNYDCDEKSIELIEAFCSKYNDPYYMAVVAVHELCHKSFHENGKIKELTFRTLPNPEYASPDDTIFQKPKKVKVFDICLDDMAVINQWNEMGADLGAFLFQREQYLQTGDISKFVYRNGYVKAIENGIIDPFDSRPEARKREYALLANSMRDWWIRVRQAGYGYTSRSDVQKMVNTAESLGILIPTQSRKGAFEKRINTCLSFKVDGKWINFYELLDNPNLSMQPMVAEEVAKAKASMTLYPYQNIEILKTYQKLSISKQRYFYKGTKTSPPDKQPSSPGPRQQTKIEAVLPHRPRLTISKRSSHSR